MILAIDIGTSTFKAALFGYDGRCTYRAAAALNMTEDADPALWLRAFAQCLEGFPPLGDADAVAISGNGPTLVPVTGEPHVEGGELVLEAGAARLWLDRRAVEEAAAVSALAGGFVDAGFFVPKALYLKNREPALYEKCRHFLSPPEFLACALTGEARTVLPSDGFERWYWDDELLRKAGLDREKFPPFVAPGDVIGTVTALAASLFGLRAGTKVYAGGPDFFAAIVGSGAVCPGEVCDRSGTSEGINVCAETYTADTRLMCFGHPVRPYWNVSGIISTAGRAIDWCRGLLGLAGRPYDAFYDLAASAESGAGGVVFLPYLAGERAPIWNADARGLFHGLGLETGRAEIARAVCEGVCLAVRDVVTVIEEAGAPVRSLRVTGGPARSPFLNQLKADVTGRPVLLGANRDAELVGLAALTAAARGEYASLAQAAGALVHIEKEFYPGKEYGEVYGRLFTAYRSLQKEYM